MDRKAQLKEKIKYRKEILRQFKKEVKQYYGEKCKDYALGCMPCNAHKILEDFELLIDDLNESDRWETKDKYKWLIGGGK